ncbi:hypothetical protein HOH87_00760 [bacterium]|jgi:hypothetical protein|nr:hypothetical protein [bacterium]
MKMERIKKLFENHGKRVISSGAFFMFALRVFYFYFFKKPLVLPWDVDLTVIVIKSILKILSFSISFPVWVLVLLMLLAGITRYCFKTFNAKSIEENPEYFKKWKDCYWKVTCRRLDSGKLLIKEMEGPYCPDHKIAMRVSYKQGLYKIDIYKCDIDECVQEITRHAGNMARESLYNFSDSNPIKFLDDDCNSF